MKIESVAEALEREHREIDEGIEAFTAGLPAGNPDREPLTRAIRALRRHIYVEEEFLFPTLREAGLLPPVLVMLREHAQIWTSLDTLESSLDAGPADATTATTLRRLNSELLHHNLKEEKVLYPQADALLPAATAEHLQEFLASGEMPEDWICQKLQGRPV